MALAAQISRLRSLLLQSSRARSVMLYLLVVLIVIIGLTVPSPKTALLAALERKSFDLQMKLLRAVAPLPLDQDVVLIGIDEKSEARFEEPLVFWHKHYARVLQALAQAGPLAVGVDIRLPERSYNEFEQGLDNALVRNLFALRQRTVLVYVHGTTGEGAFAPVHPIYLRALDAELNFGSDQHFKDPDKTARRFSERELGVDGAVRTFVGQILRGLKRPVEEGYIDFSAGGPLNYIPMQQVIDWLESGDAEALRKHFAGRVVLFGSLSVDNDRWDLPVKIATWEHYDKQYELGQPGVVLHLQTLRSHMANGLIHPAHDAWRWLLCLLTATVVFARLRTWLVISGAITVTAALLGASLSLIRHEQLLVPAATVIATLWLALFLRGILDGVESVVERTRLKRSFSGQVSPGVLDEIMTGGLEPGSEARAVDVCVIFSDIRGFTTLSETMPPDMVMNVLQRYFDRMVKSVHRFDGTIDKFIGDGMMILFGAPKPTPDPCTDAVRCALDMLDELDELNIEFEKEGLPKLGIGIGINYGKVFVGNIGSTERHNYSAIGDAVNVAARVEGQTKELGRRILITDSVVSRIGDRFNFEPLGERLVKGHSPVEVWGIRSKRNRRPDEAQPGVDVTAETPLGESS